MSAARSYGEAHIANESAKLERGKGNGEDEGYHQVPHESSLYQCGNKPIDCQSTTTKTVAAAIAALVTCLFAMRAK